MALVIATGFGVGYSPIAPGTVGSFVGILLILLLSRWELLGGQWVFVNWLVVAVIGAVGIWAGSRAEAVLGKRDPPQVVIDEIVGQLLTFGLIFRNPPFTLLFLGFLFFRFFDIVKPFPIRSLERVSPGIRNRSGRSGGRILRLLVVGADCWLLALVSLISGSSPTPSIYSI